MWILRTNIFVISSLVISFDYIWLKASIVALFSTDIIDVWILNLVKFVSRWVLMLLVTIMYGMVRKTTIRLDLVSFYSWISSARIALSSLSSFGSIILRKTILSIAFINNVIIFPTIGTWRPRIRWIVACCIDQTHASCSFIAIDLSFLLNNIWENLGYVW